MRLPRGRPLEGEAGEEEQTGASVARLLHGAPELHCQRERENRDDRGGPERRLERPDLLGDDGDRDDERREVRPTARREPRRPRLPCPGRSE